MQLKKRHGWLVIPLLGGVGVLWYLSSGIHETEENQSSLPSAFEPGHGDQLKLVASGPLPGKYAGFEPTVAADRHGRVLVVAMDHPGTPRDMRLIRWNSENDGRTWIGPTTIENWPISHGFNADPWLQTDHRDRFYQTNVCADLDRNVLMVLRRSFDGGNTWQRPVKLTTGADKPVLGISANGRKLVIACLGGDPSGQRGGCCFLSNDRGQTWEVSGAPPELRHAVPFGVVIANNGRVVSCWLANNEDSTAVRTLVCSTADRGKNWVVRELAKRTLQPGRDHPFNSGRHPALVMDEQQMLHVAWVADRGKDGGTDLFACSSQDWSVWTDPVCISPGDAIATFPALAATGRGVHVAWAEKRDGYFKVWYRDKAGNDLPWSPRLLLSPVNEASTLVGAHGFEAFAGDYMSLAANRVGSVHAVWGVGNRGEPRHSEIWHAALTWRNLTP